MKHTSLYSALVAFFLIVFFTLALSACSVTRSSDGTTTVGAQVTAEDLFAAWDRYEASKVRAEK